MTRYFATDPEVVRLSVSAVVWREAGARQLLLMQRSDNGCWGLPGGYVEPGESVADATLREVQEETGYRVELGRLVGVYSDPARQVVEYPDGARVQAVNLCFEAVAGEKGEPTTPEETLAMGFFALDELPNPFVPTHEIRIADVSDGELPARVR
jgi:ADP-ribose pyrophosphatase YjhB (NUDIX family)